MLAETQQLSPIPRGWSTNCVMSQNNSLNYAHKKTERNMKDECINTSWQRELWSDYITKLI